MNPTVVSVHVSAEHSFSKSRAESIELLEGIGVRGDAHAGVTVKHRSRVARDPAQPNLRQIHLIHQELFTHLAEQGHEVAPGELGRTSPPPAWTCSVCRSGPACGSGRRSSW